MAVPQLASAGNAPSMKEMLGQQDRAGDLLTNLVDLSKQLVDGQEKLFEKLLLVLDQKKEDTTSQRVSGSVGETEAEMPTLDFAKLLGGALAAITLWSNDLAKYIRAAFLPSQLLAPVMTAFKTAFSSAAFAKAFKPIDNFFGRINKALAPKNFVSLTKAIDFFTAKLQNVIEGFTAVGKEVEAFGKKVTVSFKELSVGGKIGASIRAIVDPFVRFFKFIGNISGITQSVGKMAGMFAKVMPILKGIASKLLLPLFAIFDFVSGFIEGFSSKGEDDERGLLEKTFDGMISGALEAIKGIFVIPLDLIKSFISWIAGKLGFKNVEKELDSFKFADIFDGIVKKIKDIMEFIKKLIKNPIDTIKAALFGDLTPEEEEEEEKKKQIKEAENAVRRQKKRVSLNRREVKRKSFRETEEESAEQLKKYEQSQVVLEEKKATLAALKAGLDPKTGKELSAAIADTSEIKPTGAQLAADTQDVATKKEEKQAGATVVSAPSDNRDMRQTSINSSTFIAPSPSSYPSDPNWDFEDARGR